MGISKRATRITLWSVAVAVAFIFIFALSYSALFGPVQKYAVQNNFIVQPDESPAQVAQALYEQGYIHSRFAFLVAYARTATTPTAHIRAGGFTISSSQDLWSITDTLTAPPYLAWVTIGQGWRKEQVADKLADVLGWSAAQKTQWLTVDTKSTTGFDDGIYYGDTYLIPTDQSTAQVAARLRARFEDVFAPYAAEAAKKGENWNKVLIMASLIEREASKNDRALVAGILWNRIEQNMTLSVDATLQYVVGNEDTGWWPVPHSADKFVSSPYNTYQHTGLPPAPIDTPTVASVEAALNPEATDCIFYIHDDSHTIHCAKTYKVQKKNIAKYLK